MTQIVRDMGISHRDFFRGLSAALGGRRHAVRSATEIEVDGPPGRVTIRLGPEGERRIGSLRLPTTRVEIVFNGYQESEIARFMREFDIHFQRGGG